MKLFQSLLVAPALLGLISPIAAKATENNLDAISNYFPENTDLNLKSFTPNTDNKSLLLSGGEGLVESDPLVDDSFSTTTSASFGANFYIGSVDNGTVSESTTTLTAPNGGGTVTSATTTTDVPAEAVTFTYDYSMGLSTTFTGEDSLDVAIIGGNADGDNIAVDSVMGGDGTGDGLDLDGIAYTFPLGGFTVIVGDGTGVDDLNTGACAYSAFTDTISDCGTSNVGGEADSAVAASYDFGNGFTVAGGIGFATEDTGILSDEDSSTIGLEAAYTADTYGISVAYTDNDEAAGDTEFYSIQASYTPDAAYSVSAGYEFDSDDADSLFLGLTTEVGPGSLSVGASTQGLAEDHEDNYMYEVAYSYAVNDGITVTPGLFIIEDADDDQFGVVVTTGFSF